MFPLAFGLEEVGENDWNSETIKDKSTLVSKL